MEKNISSKNVIDTMVALAGVFINNDDYTGAVGIYQNILRLQSNKIAQYNLGTLYALGKGVKQDFKEAAYWFNQADIAGDEQAEKHCLKCMVDFIHQDFEYEIPETIFFNMMRFVKFIWPDQNLELKVNENLFAMAGNHFNKQEYIEAIKLFRAAAEFGNDGNSQNYLAILYNAGMGIEQNDLVSLYWFDKAADNGIEFAQTDRNGILNAYQAKSSPQEFYEQMMLLSGWCSLGSIDIPKDANKAVYWREIGEKMIVINNKS